MRLLFGLQSRPPSCTTPELACFGMSLEMLLAAYIAILSPNIAIYISCALNLRIRSQTPLQSTYVDGSHEMSSMSSQVPHSSRKLIEVLSRSDVASWGTRPHSADIPIVYPISILAPRRRRRPRQLELCPCCCRRILGRDRTAHAVFGSAIVSIFLSTDK